MRIGLDVDGVFADFNTAFIEYIKAHTGIVLPPTSDSFPDIWDYDTRVLGKEGAAKIWRDISKDPRFWLHLKPYPSGDSILKNLSLVETMHEIYFITSRPGATAKFQTEAWLMRWMTLPTVLIARDKGPLVRSLKLELFVDDKPENCNEVLDATTDEKTGKSSCLVLMPDMPYNRNVIVDARVARVKNLEKALAPLLWPSDVDGRVRLVAAA